MFSLKLIMTLFFMSFILSSCKVNESPSKISDTSEYIISHKHSLTDDELKSHIGALGEFVIKSRSPRISLIKFSNDPGLEELKLIINSSDLFDSVQPNYRYQKLQ